jgi:CDGSH-type Zn-finger protein
MNNTNVTIKANGPLIVMGNFTITHPDGKVEEIEKMAALCRCGASSKKPFCDGAHGKVGFQG